MEAFKIENKVLLKDFDKCNEIIEELNDAVQPMASLVAGASALETDNSRSKLILKGLFIKIKKKTVLKTLLFGFKVANSAGIG